MESIWDRAGLTSRLAEFHVPVTIVTRKRLVVSTNDMLYAALAAAQAASTTEYVIELAAARSLGPDTRSGTRRRGPRSPE